MLGGGAYYRGLGTACGGRWWCCAFLGALNAGSPFWGAGVGSFSVMCAFAALQQVVFLGAFSIWGTSR